MTDDIAKLMNAALIERLRKRNTFARNGGTWVMLNEPDGDCSAAADAIASLRTRAEKAEAERDEWRQAAGVEASLRREFLARVEKVEAEWREYADELFDLRNRCGCGPDQEGPDVRQQLSTAREDCTRKDEALAPFATEADRYEPDEGDSAHRIYMTDVLTIGDLRRAKAARSPSPEPKEGGEPDRPAAHPAWNHTTPPQPVEPSAGADTDPPAPERTSPHNVDQTHDIQIFATKEEEAAFWKNERIKREGGQPAASSAGVSDAALKEPQPR